MISTRLLNGNLSRDWRELARCHRLVDAVAALVEEVGPLTLCALQKHLDPYYYPVYGTTLLRDPFNPKQAHWGKLSPEFADLVLEVVERGRVRLQPCAAQWYWDGGGNLLMYLWPWAHRGDTEQREHWRPVRLHPLPRRRRRRGGLT